MTNARKIANVCIGITLITLIIFVVVILVLKYSVEGESNLPFEISKIILVSNSQGIDKEDTENKWNFDLEQNNDIYIYIQNNENYNRTEILEKILLNNFSITKEKDVGITKIYKPSENSNELFANIEENEVTELEYVGESQTNMKKLQISNQGGIIAFRVGNNNIGKYISNEGEEINHTQLLKMANIKEEDLKQKIKFDITLELKGGKKFKTTEEVGLPVEGIIDNGSANKEILELKDLIFKRIEN